MMRAIFGGTLVPGQANGPGIRLRLARQGLGSGTDLGSQLKPTPKPALLPAPSVNRQTILHPCLNPAGNRQDVNRRHASAHRRIWFTLSGAVGKCTNRVSEKILPHSSQAAASPFLAVPRGSLLPLASPCRLGPGIEEVVNLVGPWSSPPCGMRGASECDPIGAAHE